MDTDTKILEAQKSNRWLFGIIITVLIVIFGAFEKVSYDRCNQVEQRISLVEERVQTNQLAYQDMRVEMRELRVVLQHLSEAVNEIKDIVKRQSNK